MTDLLPMLDTLLRSLAGKSNHAQLSVENLDAVYAKFNPFLYNPVHLLA